MTQKEFYNKFKIYITKEGLRKVEAEIGKKRTLELLKKFFKDKPEEFNRCKNWDILI